MKDSKSVSLRTVNITNIYAEIKRRRKKIALLKKKQRLLQIRLDNLNNKILKLGGK